MFQFLIRISLVFAAIALTGGLQTAMADSEGAIKYRQSVMKAVGGHMGSIAMIVKGKGGNVADLKGHAHALAELARVAGGIFPDHSTPLDGVTAAKPDIWDKPDEFKAVLSAFQAETAKLAKVADSGDMAAFGKQLGVVGKGTCGACHKTFRVKKQ